MVDTFQAIAVTVVALLPGALYVWGFEGQVGLWGVRLVDRLLRFFGYSAGFQALLSPATYWFYATYVHPGRLAAGKPLPLWLWAAAMAYVVVPFVSGRLVGAGVSRRRRWALVLVGKDPAPRAWDDVFGGRPVAWIRMKLKGGCWVGGAFAADRHGRRSYVAGYPEQQDLFLAEQAEVDPETGDFLVDEHGRVKLLDRGLLVRWEEVEYLVFQEAQQAS
jgi:Family of unknown function (DUF6338)